MMNLDLRLGDARDLMRTLPTDSVDAIVTDPPYNLAGYSTPIRPHWRSPLSEAKGAWDGVRFDPGVWVEPFKRVLKPTGTLFAFTAYNLLGDWHRTFDPAFDSFQMVVWHKTNPPPKLRRAGFLNSVEVIVACWDRGHKWNFTTQAEMHNHIEGPICQGKERVRGADGRVLHPTQKPVYVLKRLIEWATNPGDLVLDPFMGVGSVGAAALVLDRRFVGFELDQTYMDAASERLAAVGRAI